MILHVKTTTGKYDVPVKNTLEARSFLLNLYRLGIVCVWWEYRK